LNCCCHQEEGKEREERDWEAKVGWGLGEEG
jgi:hypothetical protein